MVDYAHSELGKKARSKATVKYVKNHTRRFTIQFNNDSEADAIAWLEDKANVNEYVKSLIRKDMQNS